MRFYPKFFGLIRDKNGRPKVDGDPHDLPSEIQAMLTDEDWQYLKDKHNGNYTDD